MDRRLGGPQSRSGHRGWRKNPFSFPGIEYGDDDNNSNECIKLLFLKTIVIPAK
jgi:hypothetical protein